MKNERVDVCVGAGELSLRVGFLRRLKEGRDFDDWAVGVIRRGRSNGF